MMGRNKTASGGGSGGAPQLGSGCTSPAPTDDKPGSAATATENKIKDLLKELYHLIHDVQV